MTDRELLELAAKASWGAMADQMIASGWDPLTDDGDALRLAVKLHIDLDAYANAVRCCKSVDFDDSEGTEAWESFGDDPHAATRRAIVRAAAEIGKGTE